MVHNIIFPYNKYKKNEQQNDFNSKDINDKINTKINDKNSDK
jgi:hypothetical protein